MASPGAAGLAGGTDFVTMRSAGAIAPDTVVDLKPLAELRELDALRIGSGVTMARLARLRSTPAAALRDGAALVGSPMTRNRATVGGNVCRASPAGDVLPPLLVLGAWARLASAAGVRELALDDFFRGPGLTALEPGELLVGLDLARSTGASAYERLTARAWMDLAVVGVAAWVALEDGRCVDAAVAFGGAAPTPRLVPEAAAALVGSELGEDALAAAGAAVRAAASPIDDVRGSIRHRLRALGVLTGRVVATAARRAREAAA